MNETSDLNYVSKAVLDKACSDYDATYAYDKNLAKKTISEKVLRNRTYDVAQNPKYDGCQRGLSSIGYGIFD